MATKNMALVAAVSTVFGAPRLTVIEGTETSAGVMPASGIHMKSGLLVAIGPDPDGVSTDVTGDPKVYSYQNDPKNGTANIALERYYYIRTGGTPNPPFKSVIQVFDSSLLTDTQTLGPVVNNGPPNQYLTDWGGGGATPVNSEVSNAYGLVRLGEFIYMISYDVARVTKINASNKTVLGSITFNNADYNHATPPPATVMARGQGIKVHNDKLYALFNVAENINGTTVANANYQPSILVEIDTAAFTFKDNNHTSPNYAEVGMNSVKIEGADGFLYCPAIGGPQLGGSSNTTNSCLYRVAVAASGALSAAVKAYQGHTVTTFYDIRDMAIGDSQAVILIGRWATGFASFTYTLLKVPVATLANVTPGTNIFTLYAVATNRVDSDNINGWGPFHYIRYEKAYSHFWAGQSTRIRIWDESAIAGSTSTPVPYGAQIDDAGFYGGTGYINSLEIFIDNAEEAHAEPKTLRSAVVAAGATQGGVAASVNVEKAIMRAFLEEADAAK